MNIVLLLLVCLCFSLISTSVYRTFFHKLASVPGPRLAAVSSIWYAYQVRNGRLLHLAKTLHKKYGSAVRVRPNEVWFNSKEAFKVIYSPTHGFEKSDFYLTTAMFRPQTNWRHPLSLSYPDTLDLLSERDVTRYRVQRRLIGPVYHESNIQKFSKAVDTVLERVVTELRTMDGEDLDLKEWMHIITVECLGAVVLSWSPGYLKDHSDHGSSAVGYYNWRRKSVFGIFPLLVLADLHTRWIGKAFTVLWRLSYDTRADFKPLFYAVGQRISKRLRKAREAAKAKASVHPHNDLLCDLVLLHRERPEFTDTYLRRLAVTNFGAGHETMCSALTAVLAMIASHDDVFRRAAEEIRKAELDKTPVNSAREASLRLPFTCACIKEAQRLHPALGMSLPRTVPAYELGKRAAPTTISIDGHILPSGTVVGCCPAALHRSEDIFGPDADIFRPERWLDCGQEKRIQMERTNLTWGGGSRSCPGRYLAEMVLYKTIITLIRSFDIEATMPPDGQIQYYFLSMLTGARTKFRPRNSKLKS